MSNQRRRLMWLCLLFCSPVGCSTNVGSVGARVDHDGVDSDAGGPKLGLTRVPADHRASASQCPTERGVGSVSMDGCANGDQGFTGCLKDGDCTSGVNGRCLSGLHFCETYCSYDSCSSDADCSSGMLCNCRASALSSDANGCILAACRTDADCGEGGFCSPSSLDGYPCPSADLCGSSPLSCVPGPCLCGDSCGHGFFCHTARDTCVDDSDCNNSECAYDRVDKRWSCHSSIPPF